MSYFFELDTGQAKIKLVVGLLPSHPAYLNDRIGFWRCLPGYLAINKGGCDYYNPQQRLNLWDREPTPFSDPAEFVSFPSTLIGCLWLGRRWENLKNGDQGELVYYPYEATGLTRSSESSHGRHKLSGRWTAKEGFTGSWIRRAADAASEAAKQRR